MTVLVTSVQIKISKQQYYTLLSSFWGTRMGTIGEHRRDLYSALQAVPFFITENYELKRECIRNAHRKFTNFDTPTGRSTSSFSFSLKQQSIAEASRGKGFP